MNTSSLIIKGFKEACEIFKKKIRKKEIILN